MEFKIGMLVKLKSGGPIMTVTSIAPYEQYIGASWFTTDGTAQRLEFPPKALDIVNAEEESV